MNFNNSKTVVKLFIQETKNIISTYNSNLSTVKSMDDGESSLQLNIVQSP